MSDNDIPEEMTEETATIISNKLEEHKKFFLDLPVMSERFQAARISQLAMQAQPQQMNDMLCRLYLAARFETLPDRAAKRRIDPIKVPGAQVLPYRFLVPSRDKAKGMEREVRHRGGGASNAGAVQELCVSE